MICAPESSWACFMTSIDEYLPVPTMRRDENSLPPMTRFVSFMVLASVLCPAHRSDDLHPVAFAQHRRLVRALRRDLAVHRDGGVLALDAQLRQEALHVQAVGDLEILAVDDDLHKQNGRAPSRVRPLDLRFAVFPSLELPRTGSRGPGPHPVLRIPPPTTSGRSIHQTRVSWRPEVAISRDSAPSTQLAPGGSTTDAERTWNDRGSRPGAAAPCCREAR